MKGVGHWSRHIFRGKGNGVQVFIAGKAIGLKDGHGGMISKNRVALLALVLLTGSLVMIVPVLATTTASAEAGSDVVTHGNIFAITVTGRPNTPYYIWLTRTWSLSGNPGDQPPVIVSYQVPVTQDPPDEPYIIGSYAYYNGGGRTILNDVAPSSPSMPNTSYYAKVTTDSNGKAVVALRTSANTAIQTYSVKVENPASPADDTVFVERGDVTTKRGAVSIGFDTTATLPRTTSPTPVPIITTLLPEITTALPLPTTSPTATQTQKMPSGLVMGVVALIFGVLMARDR